MQEVMNILVVSLTAVAVRACVRTLRGLIDLLKIQSL